MSAPATLRPIARRALAAQSDDRLVKLVREGHDPAFEEMVRRYRGPLVAFAAAIVSADGAEDVVQTSLAKAHGALLADSREINLRPWLFAIVRNGALNAIRGEPRVDELHEAMAISAGPSEIAEQRDDLDRLVVAMCALPAAQRQALVKRELEGVGHGEIAAQLGTTTTAVRGLIFRARSGLRDAVGALVPLPLLRTLLTEAPAIGVAGGSAGAGAAALLGGSAAKGGTVIAAAIVALGTGIAIDQGRKDGSSPGGGDGATVTRATGVNAGAGTNNDSGDSALETGLASSSAAGASSNRASAGGGSEASGDGGGSGGGADEFGSGSASATIAVGAEGSKGGGSDDPPGTAAPVSEAETDDDHVSEGHDDDHSGPGESGGDDDEGGGSSGSGSEDPPSVGGGGSSGQGPSGGAVPPGGGSSGSGSGGYPGAGSSSSGSGGHGGSGDPPTSPPEEPDDEPPEAEPPEDDSSGPGPGDEG